MKFRYINACENGDVIGTNNKEKAWEWAKSDEDFVIDTEQSVRMVWVESSLGTVQAHTQIEDGDAPPLTDEEAKDL